MKSISVLILVVVEDGLVLSTSVRTNAETGVRTIVMNTSEEFDFIDASNGFAHGKRKMLVMSMKQLLHTNLEHLALAMSKRIVRVNKIKFLRCSKINNSRTVLSIANNIRRNNSSLHFITILGG